MIHFCYVRWTEKIKFGGFFFGRYTCLVIVRVFEFMFFHSMAFRIQAKTHGAAGAVRSKIGKSLWLLFHDWTRTKFLCAWSRNWTTLSLLKLFLPFIFKSADFGSSMFCIVLDTELAYIKFINELGFLLIGRFWDTHLVLQRGTNPRNKQFDEQERCTELKLTVIVWITVSFETFFSVL